MKSTCLVVTLLLAISVSLPAANPVATATDLASGFHSPPDAAKPWVMWWWLNGNVTREGITKDLQEMKRQGINGVLIDNGGGPYAPPGVQFLSPAWHALFRYALQEAARLHMEVSANICDGWASGGPWITPDLANKKLVYSELQVDGPMRITRRLPLPHDAHTGDPKAPGFDSTTGDEFYHDVAVVAVREKPGRPVTPAQITASSTLNGYVGEWNFPPADVADSDPETYWSAAGAAPTVEHPEWLEFEYSDPLAARGIYVAPGPAVGPRECVLEASTDGHTFSPVTRFTMDKGAPKKVTFPEARARKYRLVINSSFGAPVQVAEVALLRDGDQPQLRAGIKWWWFKSGNRSFWDYPAQGPAALGEEYPDDSVSDCRASEVVDLTGHVDPDGNIDWPAPDGRWTILRFGYTLEGQRTRGTSVGGTGGYEADILSSGGIERDFQNTALPMLLDSAAVGGKPLKNLFIDSYELGADVRGQQPTWTPGFRTEFLKRRGYDLLPFLPALAHRIVDSREITDGFLEDFRWTIGDLMAEKFWQRFGELAHQHGLGVHPETGYGTYPFPHIDGLRCAGYSDMPMGEFWYGTRIMSQFNPWGDVIRTEASAAHIYGRQIVQAESLTAWTHWNEYPEALKPYADQAFLSGLNRLVLHQYTAQPRLDIKPGWQYNAGTHFDRNITWWEQARAFFQYLGRCQYLLQQGRFVADALYFYGEGVTKFVPSNEYLHPALPPGYDFDGVNADVLLHRLTVRGGRLALPSGMSYGVLVLPQDGVMSPPVVRKIAQLVAAGATIVGPKPQHVPGLRGYPYQGAELEDLADQVWGDCDGQKVKENKLGAGTLVWGKPMAEVLGQAGVSPDFEYRGERADSQLRYIHRTAGTSEIYFISNRQEREDRAECTFRVSGKRPEIWDPVTGETHAAVAFRQSAGRTTLPLEFGPYGSLFVVFRQPISRGVEGMATSNFPQYAEAEELAGPWTVSFDPKWGGPASANFSALVSWTERPEDGIKYYSGKATYRKTFDLPKTLQKPGARVALDLGEVDYVAQVRVNGKDLGILWTKPYRVELTGALKPSGNLLEIDVVNLWPNRVIGDAALPTDRRFTRTNITINELATQRPGLKLTRKAGDSSGLFASGLLGPVRIETMVTPK